MSFSKRVNCGIVALGMCLAMAAPTFGADLNISSDTNISNTQEYDKLDIGEGGGDDTLFILSGGKLTINDESEIGKDNAGTLQVEVGGEAILNGETQMPEDGESLKSRLNVYGTTFVEQLKMYGAGDDTKAVVGNGTDAVTLTIKEGLLGKDGDASITINELGTMIIEEDWGFKIDGNGDGNDAYIDLVGGTLKVNSGLDASEFDSNIKGFGVLDNWVMNAGTGNDDGFNIYTAVPADVTPVPEPASIAIWSFLGICLAGYGYRRRRCNS